MPKKDNIKIFIVEIYIKRPMRNYPTNKIVYNNTDEIWSSDLADFLDYKTSNNKRRRYIPNIFDNFSKYLWTIPLKKNSQTITQEISNHLTKSERSPLKIKSDRGAEFYYSIFQNAENIQHYSRFTDKGPSIAERVVRTVSSLFNKPVFEKRNADWLSELPSVLKKYKNSIHSSTKMIPSKK